MLNILEKVSFLPDKPRKELIFNSKNMRVVLFNIDAGQNVPLHVSESEVLMYLVDGKGSFTVGERTDPVEKGSFVVCKENEPHGMKADLSMTVLAVISPSPA